MRGSLKFTLLPLFFPSKTSKDFFLSVVGTLKPCSFLKVFWSLLWSMHVTGVHLDKHLKAQKRFISLCTYTLRNLSSLLHFFEDAELHG